MIRNLMVCGALTVVALGCGSDGDESTDTPTTIADTDADAGSGNLEAWCLGWNTDAPPIDDFQDSVEAGLARLEALLAVAPDEIADASATLLEAQQVLGDYFAENDWDPDTPRLDPRLAEVPTNEALTVIEPFAAENC